LWIAECGFRVWDWLPKPSITRIEAFGAIFLVRLVVWVVSVAVRGSKAICDRFRGFWIAELGLGNGDLGLRNGEWGMGIWDCGMVSKTVCNAFTGVYRRFLGAGGMSGRL